MLEWCRLTQIGYEKAHCTGHFGSVSATFRKMGWSPPTFQSCRLFHVILAAICVHAIAVGLVKGWNLGWEMESHQ